MIVRLTPIFRSGIRCASFCPSWMDFVGLVRTERLFGGMDVPPFFVFCVCFLLYNIYELAENICDFSRGMNRRDPFEL